MNNKNNYYAYIRVSTAKQTEGAFLAAQRHIIEEFAARQCITITQWFQESESAYRLGRPVFTHMVNLLRKGQAGGLVMHKIDRSTRNFRDWATIGELHDGGVAVHFAAESIDLGTRGGRLSADIQAVFAADYIRNLKEEIRKGQRERLEAGLYPFTAPLGYLDRGKGKPKVPDPQRAPYVRRAFELYASGEYSLRGLKRQLYREGFRSKHHARVYVSRLDIMLSDPFYMGLIRIKKTGATYAGIHEPLVSAELFKQVQAQRHPRSRIKQSKHNFLYRGMFQCRTCHSSMIGERQRGHVYYRCHQSNCRGNSLREEAVEHEVIRQLRTLTIKASENTAFTKSLKEHLKAPQHKQLDDPEEATQKIAAAKERLLDVLSDGVIDAPTYQRKLQELNLRQVEVSHTEQNKRSKQEEQDRQSQFLEHSKSLVDTYQIANISEKRRILELCFSNKYITAKKIELATKNWLQQTTLPPCVLSCAPNNDKPRSSQQTINQAIHDFQEASKCQDFIDFVDLCIAIKSRVGTPPLPEHEGEDV